ncbi:MAG TPA: 5-methyltetrahydropteroyltriglutamate--homocysteine S-methyltransferase [Sulfurovum sp.]|jgi:5-methyltetrahydropteroyltriglutamate--homocysteine methyltransferase|nr:MAG: 5-methyltetrahydropteroyltriglutamate--homocysteine S-methyltransferase [Sulfurovum sp. 35-42-20]OYY57572.1 MAG: 5-methyltetrahydropteroyltriglutamate--homocysteine S-methyltransferase [Sulfurovum sp. 28-43-6]OYZ23944.1 MAG: 5-methyltetrahydropteroyltriglutamate--homocysteine S-methyltransferase [Sulfurovum sp. 16-42-52]OYZ47955.1 MAG: 5-methyltetrahydropteroyltriglutamate--homocysteine S-methyltransferase [Sulfurovum sp. 24-42-9]OZA44471.1 MAG: 5-methyltetrahydropteroyltriglutamate--ho
MSKNYVVGFPRIGEQRELKVVLESYWAQKTPFQEVQKVASTLKKRHWEYQKNAGISHISTNDFSLYDTMLDMAVTLGAIPSRFASLSGETRYFAMARGNKEAVAMEMTKWFNTNYHYIVPELSLQDAYVLDATKVINEYKEAKALGIQTKINLIGPLTFLGLSKRIDGGDTYELFSKILPVYEALLKDIASLDEEILVQIDEPILVKDLEPKVLSLLKPCYDVLAKVSVKIKIVLTTYFEHSNEATKILVHTPVWAIGLDFMHGEKNLESLELIAQSDKKLIAGVVDGRNIWKNDMEKTLGLLETIARVVPKEKLIVGTSCSLLHTPFSLKYEENMDAEIKNWLSYAVEKLDELSLLGKLFFEGKETLSQKESALFAANRTANESRKNSARIHDSIVQERVRQISKYQREGDYKERIEIQKAHLAYDDLATTTIGSFPQTPELRKVRADYKKSAISQEVYEREIKTYIDECVAFQEEVGLEILVHGEPERNDMVEYFGEQLKGYGFSQNGWVQSYGSRCVKPPFIYGDISRPEAMTVAWTSYAQSKTKKIMKGMLTGPVTILNWSFVRDDKSRDEVAEQIAIALSDEVDDLQKAGIKMIQVDEAAFKEGYPLRKENIELYEKWAVENFKLCVSTAHKETQIHTHMCYSQFNDIIHTIEAMDADVISIETARSGNTLLKIFKETGYKQEVGPGIYDIHSPRIPSVEEMVKQIELLLEVLPAKQLWINPDCGLKTRKWEEVKPSLINMVTAVKEVRKRLA